MSVNESEDDISTEHSEDVNYEQDIAIKIQRDLLSLNISGPSRDPQDSEATVYLVDNDSLISDFIDTNASTEEKLHERRNYSSLINEMKTELYDMVESDDDIQDTLDQFLTDRLELYYIAQENERIIGNENRVQYLNEGVKTLLKLIARNNAGQMVSFDSIPPELEVFRKSTTNPTVSFKKSAEIFSIESDSDSEDSKINRLSILSSLVVRRDQYRKVAVQHRKAGNISRAHENLKIANQFEGVKNAIELGEVVDLKQLPGPPERIVYNLHSDDSNVQDYRNQIMKRKVDNQSQIEEPSSEEQLTTHSSILRTLKERLKFYEIEQDFAKIEGSEAKADKIALAVKQYEHAIRLHEAGKPILAHELPTPSGQAPLLNIQAGSKTRTSVASISSSSNS